MPKVVKSPSKRWEGSVTFADPLTMPQVKEFEAALDKLLEVKNPEERIFLTVADEKMLPAIIACVDKWELVNFPETVTLETFPLSPRPESHEFIAWLFNQIRKVWIGEVEIPNE